MGLVHKRHEYKVRGAQGVIFDEKCQTSQFEQKSEQARFYFPPFSVCTLTVLEMFWAARILRSLIYPGFLLRASPR